MAEGRAGALLAVLCLSGLGCTPSEPTRPDVLLVTIDTLRAEAVAWAPTPTLDRLAAGGVRFEDLVSVGFGTTPSHASLFTSSHPRDHGVLDNNTPLTAEVVTLAEVLSEAGWTTAAFVSAAPVASELGLDQGFAHYDDSFGHERRAGETIDALLSWWRTEASPGPLFTWLHLYDPHQPYDPPPPFAVESGELEVLFREPGGSARFVFPEQLEGFPVSKVDRLARELYAGEITYLDRELGRVVEALDRKGRLDSTLILVASDHGESFLSDGLEVAYRHQELRSSVSRLLAILKPVGGHVPPGVWPELTASSDLGPTLLGLLEVGVPESWKGRSLAARLKGAPAERDSQRRVLVLEGSDPPLVAVRTPRWLFVQPRDPGGASEYPAALTHQLFDLESDPEERVNLYDREGELVARLATVASAFLEGARRSDPLSDAAHLEALRALGYL